MLELALAGHGATEVRQWSRQYAGIIIGRLNASRQAGSWCSG